MERIPLRQRWCRVDEPEEVGDVADRRERTYGEEIRKNVEATRQGARGLSARICRRAQGFADRLKQRRKNGRAREWHGLYTPARRLGAVAGSRSGANTHPRRDGYSRRATDASLSKTSDLFAFLPVTPWRAKRHFPRCRGSPSRCAGRRPTGPRGRSTRGSAG